jgi:hypothetical protein
MAFKYKSRKIIKKNKSRKNNKRNKTMKGRGKQPKPHKLPQIISGLALDLKNGMYENNKINFDRNKKYFRINSKPDFNISELIKERDINIIGPDFAAATGEIEQYILTWIKDNPDIDVPWFKYIGKICKIPPGFFKDDVVPQGHLYNVKNNPNNFNTNFPQDPTNSNIKMIKFNILKQSNEEGEALNNEGNIIPPGKYKFVLMGNNSVRFIKDAGNDDPYYYLPAIMLYFYNIDIVKFEELKWSLGNEIPHTFLFNPRIERILSAGDFIVDENGYIIKMTGYSGHTKPRTSNVYLAAEIFNNMGYRLQLKKPNTEVSLQTGNTERDDINNRLLGTFLNVVFIRPVGTVAVEESKSPNQEEIVMDEEP